jgi:signal transduction histidine kinase
VNGAAVRAEPNPLDPSDEVNVSEPTPEETPRRTRGTPGSPAPSEGVSEVQGRVLIVDDDPMLLMALEAAMSWRLPRVSFETCGVPVTALTHIEENDYDVVVSDLLMGGLHGLELLERIKARRPTAMVLLITGAADRDLSVRALRGGAYDFIQKPVDADYLAASIRRALETRRLRAEVERQQESLRRHADGLEQIVASRTEELRAANRAKDEFLATISHELRTPLTAIFGWARLLAGGRLDGEEQAMAVASIVRNARSQGQLIDDLLDVSRIITGKLRLDVQQVDLAGALDAALGVVLPAAQAKGITITPHLDAGTGGVPADPDRLQQILWNLLSNAIKFTPAGGQIEVRVARREGRAEIEVTDSGIGIEPDLLPFVFDRFRQGQWQQSARRGLGLGLSIVRHLVELHGGTVTAASGGVGAGATLKVILPGAARAIPEAAAPRRRGRRSSPSVPGRADTGRCLQAVRVLVVDDDADTREVLRLMLEKEGAVVETASSAEEARADFQEEPPDFLLCDIGLGSEDGCDLLRELRALPPERGGDVPAIALTGYAKPEDRDRALDAGFQLHLAKPGPANLATVVASLLQPGEPA